MMVIYRPRDDDDLSEPQKLVMLLLQALLLSMTMMFYQETKGSLRQPNEFLSN